MVENVYLARYRMSSRRTMRLSAVSRLMVAKAHCARVVASTAFSSKFIQSEFGKTPAVVKCQRLGRQLPNRVRPLLVVLQSRFEAASLIQMDKDRGRLGRTGHYKSVYVNPDLTKAEADAAYNERVRRRERLQQRANNRLATAALGAVAAASTSSTGPATETTETETPVLPSCSSTVSATSLPGRAGTGAGSGSGSGAGSGTVDAVLNVYAPEFGPLPSASTSLA